MHVDLESSGSASGRGGASGSSGGDSGRGSLVVGSNNRTMRHVGGVLAYELSSVSYDEQASEERGLFLVPERSRASSAICVAWCFDGVVFCAIVLAATMPFVSV